MTTLQARGVSSVLGVIWAVALSIQIFLHGEYNFSYILFYAMGSFIGGYIGSEHVIRLGNHLLRKTVIFGIGILAVYFLFFAR